MTITEAAPTTTATSAAESVARLRRNFDSGLTRPISWRQAQLDGLLQMLDEEEDRFVAALASDLGKPTLEGWVADLGAPAGEIRYMRKNLASWAKPRRVRLPLSAAPGKGRIVPEPLGVALIIAPWNYPVQLLVEPLAAALAAGNTVLAKPSELAPATSTALAECLPRYIDTDALTVVEGGPEVATDLLAQRYDHIFFTGSTRVGQTVMEAAAKHLTPVTLELGGKSPTIVDISANLEVTARRIAWGKFLNAGQTCIAPDYVLVHPSQRDELVDQLQAAVAEFYGGDPRISSDYARIVNNRHLTRLEHLLDDADIAFGGDIDHDERYLSPTVIVDPPADAPVMQEEIFGPILPVIGAGSTDAAIDFVRSRPKPLALYVFAEDKATWERVLAETSSGGACVNHTLMHHIPHDLPFGGVGASGIGRYHGQAGFDTFSNLKSVLTKGTRPDPSLTYAPYTSLKERIIRKAI